MKRERNVDSMLGHCMCMCKKNFQNVSFSFLLPLLLFSVLQVQQVEDLTGCQIGEGCVLCKFRYVPPSRLNWEPYMHDEYNLQLVKCFFCLLSSFFLLIFPFYCFYIFLLGFCSYNQTQHQLRLWLQTIKIQWKDAHENTSLKSFIGKSWMIFPCSRLNLECALQIYLVSRPLIVKVHRIAKHF